MSSGQQPGPQPVSSTWTEPPWCGWIETTRDALLILEAARRGLIPRVTRRLVDSERRMITSGSVFVFDEDESGIKRWTDGFFWSPSRILGNFLLYRETDKRGAGHRNLRTDQEVSEGGSSENLSLSRPRDPSSSLALDKHRERSLVGSLTNSYKFKDEGLMKKTFSLTIGGVAQHLISYYKVADVESGRLRSPSSLPELASLDISPEYLDKTHFRNPPKVEIGADGIPRYRGEADDLDISPTSSTLSGSIPAPNIPPLLTEGRVTEGLSKRGGKRFDPYPHSSGTKQRRKGTSLRASSHDGSNPGGENVSSPVASGSNTPTITAQSPPSAAQPESDVPMTSAPPAVPHPPPYGMPAYFPGYLPPPGHMYGPAPPQPGVSMAPYPPPAQGPNNGSVQYAPYGYHHPTTVAHPSASTNLVTMPTQVRVSDQSQAGLVPITSQQPGPAPAAAPVPGHPGQVTYSHGPPPYHYSYYPPHPAQFQPHGYAPAPGYPWPYAAYSVPPPPPHPSAGQQQPQASPVQAGATSYSPQAAQPQQRGSIAGSTQAEEGEAPMEEN